MVDGGREGGKGSRVSVEQDVCGWGGDGVIIVVCVERKKGDVEGLLAVAIWQDL